MSDSVSLATSLDDSSVRGWRRVFTLDSRSLALARIMAGLVMMVDLTIRMTHAHVFYAEFGMLPRATMLQSYLSLPFPSLHIANDTLFYQMLLLAVQWLAALALLVGFRTRLATVLSWGLLISLHARNPFVLNSGDELMAALLFWGMFLPWGRVWSWDARSNTLPPVAHLSAATVAWLVQMASLYLFAALHKLHPYWIADGTAIEYALSIDPHATRWAGDLLAYPKLLAWLTPTIVLWEFAVVFVLLAPWPRVRLLGVVACMAMHWGFGACLEIGIFRWAPWVGLLALLPSLVFRPSRPSPLEDRLDPTLLTVSLLAICCLTWTINLESLGKGKLKLLPQVLRNLAPALSSTQYWGVFVGDGLKDDSWASIEITTRSGGHYDAWFGDRPFRKDKAPGLLSATYPDDRWRKWMMNLSLILPDKARQQAFTDWWLRDWDRRHPDDPAVGVTVWQVFEPTHTDGTPSDLYWQTLIEARP